MSMPDHVPDELNDDGAYPWDIDGPYEDYGEGDYGDYEEEYD